VADLAFHPEAQAEYDSAQIWYQARSPRTAERFEAEMSRVLNSIVDDPDTFPHYDDDHRFALLRRFPYGIIYQVHSGSVYIVAVAHTGRSPGYWQDRA
jgi:toxin ParE1/3/4